MKKHLFFLLALFMSALSWQGTAQVTVGDGTATQRYPLGNFWGYERSAAIYTAAELTSTGTINTVAWYANTAGLGARPIKIYLKQTTATTETTGTWASKIADATLVYSGSMTPISGWNTFILDTPFPYTGNNLEVLVEANYGGTGNTGGSGGNAIRYTSKTGSHIYWQKDNSPPTTEVGTVNSNRPNIRLDLPGLPACTGTPIAGATVISPTSGGLEAPFNVSTTGYSTGISGLVFQWEYRFNAEPWVNYGIPSSSYSDLDLQVNEADVGDILEMRLKVTCSNSEMFAYSSSGTYEIIPALCIPSSSSSSDYLSSITSAQASTNISYSVSSMPTGGYDDKTSLLFESYETQTFNINTTYVGGANGVNIWVDWNNDLAFDENEKVGSLTNSSATKTFSITVPAGTPTGEYRMRVRGQYGTSANPPACGSINWGSAVDFTLTLVDPPSCLAPTELATTSVGSITADVEWTPSGTEESWNISWGAFGYTVGVDDLGTGTTTIESHQITGLDPNTQYQFYVQADCGGQDGVSQWAGPLSFRTACGAMATLFENFDSYDTGSIVPDCWTRLLPATSAGSQTISSTTPASGTRNIYQYTGSTSNSVIVVLPPFSNINEGTHWLRFKARVSSGAPGTLQVGYVTDDTDYSSFTLMENVSIINTSYATDSEYTVVVPSNVPSNARVAIKNANDGKSYYWDDVYWEEGPSCMPPTDLAIDNITQTGAELTWTTPANQSDIYIALAGDPAPDESSTPTNSGVTTPTTLSNLTNSTTYDVYVRADCGGNDGVSTWAGPLTFTTACGVASVPYLMDFETAIVPNLPACTSRENNGIGNDWKTKGGSTSGFTGKVLNYSYHFAPGRADSWFYTQGILLYSNVTYDISFLVGNNSTTWTESMKVAYGTSPTESAMVNQITDLPEIATITPLSRLHSFNVPADGVYYFGFNVYSMDDQNQLYLDDINIFEAPECPNPSNLSVSDIGETSVELNWDHPGANYYNLIVREADGDPYEPSQGDITDEDIESHPYIKTGLTPNTTYEFYVIADCDMYWSGFVGPFTFTTLATPPSNDEACGATVLACGDSIVQSLAGATASIEDNCFGSGSADVWFTFTSDGSQAMTVAETSSFDAIVHLFKGDDCGDLEEVGACKDSPENYTVTDAGTYYFRVRPYFSFNDSGTITVSLTCVDRPTNDNCANAIVLECNADPVTYSSVGSAAVAPSGCSIGASGIWFSFVGTGADITINSTASFDHKMSMQTGSCNELTWIACRDGSSGAETYTIEASVADQMYYVYVAHWSASTSSTGDITISIDCAVVPECEAPTLTLAAQDANGGSIDCLEFDGDYYVLATLSGGSGNTSYYVTANDYNAVEVNADGSVVVGPFDAGTAVDVTATGVQDGDCSVSATINSPAVCPPSNDDPEDAVLLACGDSYEGSTAAATQSMGATQLCATFSSGYSKDVWFAFEADGISEYTLQGSGFDGVIEVYSGPVDDLTAIGCVDQYGQSDEIILADLDEGTYYVRYFAYSTSNAGDYTFSLSCYTPELCDEVDAGIASASTDVVCAGVSFTLSVEGSTMDDEDIVGLTGQWQAMINGDWTDISGANGVSYTVANGITEETSYRFVLTCSEGNSDTSNSVTVSINPDVSQCYCEPSFPSAVEPITYVGFEDIDNTTSATLNGTPALEDFTDQTAFVAQGGEYPIEVKGNTNGNFTTKIVVYIDWNQDGIFDNSQGSNEMYLLPDIRNSNGQDGISSEGTIAVPASALLGNTRMRVMKKFSSVPGPCNASGYGQAEDYTVNVGTDEPEPCLAPESVVVSDITANSAQISWSGGSEEGYWIIAYGPVPYYPAEDDGENGYYGGNMTETLTGLEPGTEYNVYVRAMCQESYDNLSDWTSASFTTDEEPCVISGQIIGLYVDEPATVCQDAGELIVWWDSLGDYGEKMAFIITDQNNNILDIINEDFDTANVMEVTADFTGYDEGDYLIQHITWNGEITGLVVGNNTSEVEGDCKAWAVNQIGVTVEDCTVVPECESPLGITVDNITEDGAEITWSAANAGDNQWQISLTVGGQGPDEGIIASVSGTPAYTATGLDPATTYTVYLRTVCSSEVSSDWAFNGEFTTLEAEEECESPLGITVDNITEDGAEITWSAANAGDDQWEISLTVGGQTADQGIIATVTGTPTYTATGLDPDTTYTVYLRTICSSEVSSDWAFNGDFTTLEAEEPGSCEGIDAFVTTWTTTASGQSITIPTYSGETYDYTVDWGDGSSNTNVPGNISHTYANAGTYTVSICGTFPRIYFNNGGDRLKIKSIEQWGTNVWSSMNSAFMGAENLVSHATDMPNLSMVTDMYGMFAFARKFNGDAQFGNWNVGNVTDMMGMFAGASIFNYPIGGWNVGNVTTMESMFFGATIFNQPLGNWNVSSVTTMRSMFQTAYEFNQSLNNWNVDNVTDMYGMFAYARKFNGEIGNWNVGNVTNMTGMFGAASKFNKPIDNWNVGNVTSMEQMFHGATVFNQDLGAWNVGNVTNMRNMFATAMKFNYDIGNWNVGNVTNMFRMFFHANSFDQDLGGWNVSNVTDMTNMFVNVKLSTANYDSLLNGWSALPLQHNVKFHGGNSNYCAGEVARQNMISNYGWIIQDGGMDCSNPFNGDRLDTGDSAALFGVSLYPNPMKDQLNLGNPKNVELESISIFDLTGRMVQKVDLNGITTGTVIDVSRLSSATYMVLVKGKYGQTTELLIKE